MHNSVGLLPVSPRQLPALPVAAFLQMSSSFSKNGLLNANAFKPVTIKQTYSISNKEAYKALNSFLSNESALEEKIDIKSQLEDVLAHLKK